MSSSFPCSNQVGDPSPRPLQESLSCIAAQVHFRPSLSSHSVWSCFPQLYLGRPTGRLSCRLFRISILCRSRSSVITKTPQDMGCHFLFFNSTQETLQNIIYLVPYVLSLSMQRKGRKRDAELKFHISRINNQNKSGSSYKFQSSSKLLMCYYSGIEVN